MKLKVFLIVVCSLVGIFLLAFIYLQNFELFEVERVNKAHLEMPECDIYADYIPGNATAQDNLQIRAVCNSDNIIMANVLQFNSLSSMQLINDSLIIIDMHDTLYSRATKTDTLILPPCCR